MLRTAGFLFKDATKIQSGRQKSMPKFLVEVRNYSNFTITFPTIWRCAGDFFKVLLKFKMAATDRLLKKLFWSIFFFNFNMTFLATSGCARDFLTIHVLPKFKMAARFFAGAKTLKLKEVLLKFKMATRDQLQFFCGRKTKVKGGNHSNFTIRFPTIWRSDV